MLAGTFTILARDPGSDQLGLAVQSKFLAVGAAVPSARAGVGVVASQAWSNPTYGPRALALLAEGRSPRETVAQLVGEDDERHVRQVGVMDAQGRSAVHTGRHCFPWAGSVEDQDLVCLGNVLAGPEVVEAMAERYSNPDVDRLIDEAAVLTDRAKTQQAYWRIQKLLMDDVAMIPIYYAVNLYVKSKKVQNFRVHPLELLDLSETTIEE